MKKLAVLTLSITMLAVPIAYAKQPAAQAHKTACNKAWPKYKKDNGLKGYDRKAFMEKCMAGPQQ